MSYSFDDEDSVAEELEESLNESLDDDNYSDDNNYSEDYHSVSVPNLNPANTSAINLDDLVVSPVPVVKSIPKSRARISPTKSNSNNISSDDADDYSLSFDDDSENNTVYSEEFDDISAMSMSRSSPMKQTRQVARGAPKQQSVSFQPPETATQQQQQPPDAAPTLPSLAVQSLEAERAMEKLSKEIVYLRNQQRIALKDRRVEARNKKLRAEERRRKHQQDLLTAHQQVAALQLENKRLGEQVAVLEVSLLGAEESKALASGALQSTKAVLVEQQQRAEQLEERVVGTAELLKQREAEWAGREADLAAKGEALRTSLVTAELHVSVMAKSNEAAEERYVQCSRDKLVQVHQLVSYLLSVTMTMS
jgi:hypothetical protein